MRMATHLITRQKVAIKIINKVKVGKDLFRVKTEIEALKILQHDNIAKLLQVIEDSINIYLVMEVFVFISFFENVLIFIFFL